jgi:hypothetical protein
MAIVGGLGIILDWALMAQTFMFLICSMVADTPPAAD